MEWEILRWIVALLWMPFVPFVLAKRSEFRQEKIKSEERIAHLEIEFAVLKETAVTEVSLRDYISTRFEKSDQQNKEELKRLESKIDDLTKTVNLVVSHLPKRAGEK